MTRFIYDYTDGPKHQFNDYLSMDLDGKVHATWPISDHMYMDMDDGSLHMFSYDEHEERRRREKQRQREAHHTTNSGKA